MKELPLAIKGACPLALPCPAMLVLSRALLRCFFGSGAICVQGKLVFRSFATGSLANPNTESDEGPN